MTLEALKLALEALEELFDTNGYWWQEVDEQTLEKIEHSITAIKEALAQPEQELVATVTSESGNADVKMSWWHEPALPVGTKLYTTPPQGIYYTHPQEQQSCDRRTWVGLTDDELEQLSNKWRIIYGGHVGDFAREIEAKLKEKNT